MPSKTPVSNLRQAFQFNHATRSQSVPRSPPRSDSGQYKRGRKINQPDYPLAGPFTRSHDAHRSHPFIQSRLSPKNSRDTIQDKLSTLNIHVNMTVPVCLAAPKNRTVHGGKLLLIRASVTPIQIRLGDSTFLRQQTTGHVHLHQDPLSLKGSQDIAQEFKSSQTRLADSTVLRHQPTEHVHPRQDRFSLGASQDVVEEFKLCQTRLPDSTLVRDQRTEHIHPHQDRFSLKASQAIIQEFKLVISNTPRIELTLLDKDRPLFTRASSIQTLSADPALLRS